MREILLGAPTITGNQVSLQTKMMNTTGGNDYFLIVEREIIFLLQPIHGHVAEIIKLRCKEWIRRSEIQNSGRFSRNS